jgi:hypothetical protein
MSYANRRTDGNQDEIVTALRQVGASVQSLTAVKNGCPDILVGFRGVNFLMEIKITDGKLSPDEKVFFATWLGHVDIVRSSEAALMLIGAI